MKDAFYFSHDSNARNDPKMLLLRARLGPSGYAHYFMTLEVLREQDGYRIPAGEFVEQSIAIAIGCSQEEVAKFLSIAVEVGLLKRDSHIYSESMIGRMKAWDEAKERKSVAAKIANLTRWGGNRSPVGVRSESDCDPSKGKESKVKDRKVEDMGCVRPTIDEVASYCRERGNRVDAQKWHDYYSSNGWRVGKNPMKDWRAAVRTWERSEFTSPRKQVGQAAVVPGKYDNL